MDSPITVRPARVEDVGAMARLIVRSWQETYRGLMPDRVLDDPGFVEARERFWTAALVDKRDRPKLLSRAGVCISTCCTCLRQSTDPVPGPLYLTR
jgi:hypothetical protein